MPDPVRGLPDIGGGGIVAPSSVQGGEGSLAAAQAMGAMARAAAELGSAYEERRLEQQRVDDQTATGELLSSVSVGANEEGEAVIRGLEAAVAIQDPDQRQRASVLASTAAARNALRERITAVQDENPLDVGAQEQALVQFRDQIVSSLDPAVAGPVQIDLQARISEALDGEARRAAQAEVDENRENLNADLSAAIAERDTLIRQYGTAAASQTAAFQRAEAQIDDVLTQLSLDVYGYSDADINTMRQGAELSRDLAVSIEAIDQTFDAEGPEAAVQQAREIADGLELSTEQAEGFFTSLNQHVRRREIRLNASNAAVAREEAEQASARNQAQAVQYNALRRGLADGSASLEDVESARESEEISDAQYTQLYIQLADNDDVDTALYNRLTDAQGNPQRLDPTNRDDREAVDTLFNRAVQQAGGLDVIEADPNLMATVALSYADQYGIIPDTAASRLRAQAMSGNIDGASNALSIISQVENQEPFAAQRAFSDDLLGDAAVYANMVAGGVSPEEAFGQIQASRETLNTAGRELRTQRARQAMEDLSASRIEVLFNEEDGFFERNPFFDTSSSTAQADAALSTYAQLYEDAYVRFGNPESAEAFAAAAIRRTYGVTRISGQPVIMKHAPDVYYGGGGEWMGEQLVAAVGEQLDLTDVDNDQMLSSIQLVSDHRTSVDVGQGRAPSYSVVYQRDDGVMEALPGRFVFDGDEALEEAERERREANQQELDRARERRLRNAARYNTEEILGDLGYPQSEIDRLTRPFNQQLAQRLIRQQVQYEGE